MQWDKFKSDHKPNEKLFYRNKESNHPAVILKILVSNTVKHKQDSISKCHIILYNNALRKSGFSEKIQYSQITTNNNWTCRTITGKVLWFNFIFNITVKTNIVREFLKLVS